MRQARHKRGQEQWAMHAVRVMALKEVLTLGGNDSIDELMDAVIDLCLEAIDGDYARKTSKRISPIPDRATETAALMEAFGDGGGQQRDSGGADQLRLDGRDGLGDEDGLDDSEDQGGDDSLAADQDASC